MSVNSRLIAVAVALCLAFASQARGALLYDLTGFSSDDNLPLSAHISLDALNPYELKVSITNQSYDAGPDNRITHYGIQIGHDAVTAAVVAAETKGTWSIIEDSKLPGGGAPTFEFLHSSGVTPPNGLYLDDTLTILFTSTTPIFDPLDISAWNPANKGDYLMAAKWQSVGILNDNDSGTGGTLTLIPEPSTASLLGLPALLLLMRRRRHC